uniref:Signal recognition particle receptor alpha subunit N-terminal domain-containing protein n=1 Tax=Panagrolaimus superbus TaxID=310955 RepID=A0A914YU88_9BILA
MIETAADRQAKAAEKVKADQKAAAEKLTTPQTSPPNSPYSGQSEEDEEVLKNLEKLKNRGKKPAAKKEEPKKPGPSKKGKEGRKWDLGGKAADAAVLDYSAASPDDSKITAETEEDKKFYEQNVSS